MIKKGAVVVGVLCYILASLYIALSIGIFNLPDSFFFYNIGNFLLFKKYYSIFPFNSYYPNTVNAPLYGIVIRLISSNVHIAMTVISFTQLVLVGVSAYFIYTSANFIKRGLGVFAAAVFFLLPFLFTYATAMMSEVFTIFLVSLYQYVALGLLTKRIRVAPSVLVLFACLLTLTKFVFLYFIPVSVVLTLYVEYRMRKTKHFRHLFVRQLPGILGIVCVFLWAGFVHSYYGRWGLTVTTGRALFQGVVSKSGLFPSPDSSAYKTFQYWTGLATIPKIGADRVEGYFQPAFARGKITEPQMDDVFRNFALTAIQQHAASFMTGTFRGIYGIFTSSPYHACLLMDLGEPDAQCSDQTTRGCRIPWFCSVHGCPDSGQSAMCQPTIKNTFMNTLWANLISFYEEYYPYVMVGVFGLLCFGAIVGIVRRSIPMFIVVFHGALLLGIQGMFSDVEGRYTMIVYPFISILLAYGIWAIVDFIVRAIQAVSRVRVKSVNCRTASSDNIWYDHY